MTYPFGTVTVGRLALREDYMVQEDNQGVLSLTGQDTTARHSVVEATWLHDELLAMQQTVQPITFTSKPSLNGWYLIGQVQVTQAKYDNTPVTVIVDWSLTAQRVGFSGELLVESRMVGNGRATDFALTPQKWHSAARGALSYYTGATVPSFIDRVAENGSQRVWLGVPQNPQWTIDPLSYFNGSVKLTVASYVRSGLAIPFEPASWSLDNGLVKVQPGVGANHTFIVSCFDGTAWRAKNVFVKVGAYTLPQPITVSVLRNDPEQAIIRLEYDLLPGRAFIDVGMRRGSRFADLYIQTGVSTTLNVGLNTAEAATAITGAITATADDANGQRYVIGSAHTFTSNLTSGNISATSTTKMDAFVGFQVGGGSAQAGDQAADLVNQYLGLQAETTRLVRR